LVLLAAQIGWCDTAAVASPSDPAFEEFACYLPNARDVAAGLRCGTVRVPRNYALPRPAHSHLWW
jgi:hypothetical protein